MEVNPVYDSAEPVGKRNLASTEASGRPEKSDRGNKGLSAPENGDRDYENLRSVSRRKWENSPKCIAMLVAIIVLVTLLCVTLGILIWKILAQENGDRIESTSQHGAGPCYPNPCMNSGECHKSGETFTCQCPVGFGSTLCEQAAPCSPNPCMNSGECYESGENLTCLCPSGFGSTLCEIAGAEPCSPNPCANSGECYERGENFTCLCPSQFKGELCEEEDYWLPYVDGCIRGYNDVTVSVDSLDVCMALCEAIEGFCCSVEYAPAMGTCYLSSKTSETVPRKEFTIPCYTGDFERFAERVVKGCRSQD